MHKVASRKSITLDEATAFVLDRAKAYAKSPMGLSEYAKGIQP